ncbi:MAG TPA: class I SAM-dependent methyltransferase [Sulfurovum sp.]|nr:class I SAM-dependent methyltransferase [Sulfurovum sp.]
MIPFNYLGWFFKTFGSIIYPKVVREELCKFLKNVPRQAKILDLGAGTGMMSEFSHTCRDDLYFMAVDPAKDMLKYALPYIKTQVASAEDIPFEERSFDVVLMGESLHHFNNIDQALKEIVRVLKKEGKIFIYDFDVSTFLGKSICRGEKLLGEPGHFFVPEILKNKLEDYGFTAVISKHSWRYTIVAKLS